MITIEVRDKEAMGLLKKLYKKTGNLTPAMEEIGEIIIDSVEENFEQEGRPERWPRLRLATIKERQRKGHWPGKILQRSGELAGSISKHVTKTSVAVGTNRPHAAIHQFGGRAGRGRKVRIPARPYLMVQDEDIEEIKNAIVAHMKKGVE